MLTVHQTPEPAIATPEPAPAVAPKLTKAQKRALHAEQQKQLWDSAENPDRFHWLEAQGVVPLKQEYKQNVTVLSRKPVAPVIAKRDATNGVAKLNLEDEGDSEEEDRKKRESELEERQRKAKLEREEKQRKYAEARERIMGSSSPASGASATAKESSNGRKARSKMNGTRTSQPTSSADQSPARPGSGNRELFDPEDMRRMPKREVNVTPKEDLPSRQPRGPESGGRGGFGFAARGGQPGP